MYLALARKYRPQKFEDLIGQPHITKTLQNAITLDKLYPSLIFSGTKGVGKTSAAPASAIVIIAVRYIAARSAHISYGTVCGQIIVSPGTVLKMKRNGFVGIIDLSTGKAVVSKLIPVFRRVLRCGAVLVISAEVRSIGRQS